MGNVLKVSGLKIRRARISDAPSLAKLAGELGYPTSTSEMRIRLQRLRPAADNAVFVAENSDRAVIGWLHATVSRLLEVSLRAEVEGLVVAEGHRSTGAGAQLLQAAEEWARKRKCVNMSVRSNVLRERAHGFYERQGYEHIKTQKAFLKPL
jgi:GNAT superfamily N-acetyltransferase